METELCILFDNENMNRDLLANFPYLEGQFYSHEEDNEVSDVNQTWVFIDLGDKTDITSVQEQFLNSIPEILEYTIR